MSYQCLDDAYIRNISLQGSIANNLFVISSAAALEDAHTKIFLNLCCFLIYKMIKTLNKNIKHTFLFHYMVY